MMRARSVFLSVAVAAALQACSTWVPVAYTPAPGKVTNMAESFERLVMTGRGQIKPSSVQFKTGYIELVFGNRDELVVSQRGDQTVISGGHTQTKRIVFDRISSLTIESKRDKYYDVDVQDRSAKRMYRYGAMDLEQAQQFVDTLTAMIETGASGNEEATDGTSL